MPGAWHLEEEGLLAVFMPSEPWPQGRRFELRIPAGLSGENGIGMAQDFFSVFTIGINRELPFLISAWRAGKIQERLVNGLPGAYSINEGWEKDDRICFVFSKAMDNISVRNNITIIDGPNLIMETTGYKTDFIFRFDNKPLYNSRFIIKINSGIKDIDKRESSNEYYYRIHVNGIYSKPPSLRGIRMPMVPSHSLIEPEESDYELFFSDISSLYNLIPITEVNYPSGTSVRTWIELYFETALGAVIDIFSLMELFRIETTNNVLTFSALRIKTDNFTIEEPQSGLEDLYRIEISGNLINSTNYGIVNFQIASGLRDSLGNLNDSLQRIALIK